MDPEIYDYVEADTLGDVANETILHQNDYIEVYSVVKETDAVLVKGYSHISGDDVTYIIPNDTEVGLWTV